MTAGIPDEMRRSALVSLAAHAALLAALSMVPLVKVPTMGGSSIQVTLVSKGTAPTRPAQLEPRPAPKPLDKTSPPPLPKPVERPAPTVERPAPGSPPAPALAKARQAEALQKRIKEVPVPQPVTPVRRAPVAAQAESPKPLPVEPVAKREAPAPSVAQQEPVVQKHEAAPDLNAALRRAEEALRKPQGVAAGKPAAPVAGASPKPRTTDEINKLLGQLPPAPTGPDPVRSQAAPVPPAPTVAMAPQGTAQIPRTAALERCPPKARSYCPLLEAAINRVWNADTDPGIRSVLESAGDSTATIRMVIQPDGVIKDIQLSKSSGNEAYDRAVQSVLRELRRLPPLPAEMKGEPFVAVTSFTYTRKRDS